MRAAGIIAEYDPFHNGHARHIAAVRAAGCTHVAVVLSGAFTQRGEPALLPKWQRAEMALACGADLVLELPVPWAMAPAELFAGGGVAMLRALGCISVLSFGSECGDAGRLQAVAQALDSPAHRVALRQALRTGLPYAAARQAAVAGQLGDQEAALLASPNNTLGIEYLRAITRQQAPFSVLTIPRQGAGHGQPASDGIASAGWLRSRIRAGETAAAVACMPAPAAAILQQALAAGQTPADPTRLETAMLARLRTLSPPELAALPYLSEGLEHRLTRAVRSAGSLPELLTALRTRRYPEARLRRILWSALLGIPPELPHRLPPYIRLLGLNARGQELLAAAHPTLPLLSGARQLRTLPPQAQQVFALEQRASDLYALTLPRPQPCGTDLTTRLLRQD